MAGQRSIKYVRSLGNNTLEVTYTDSKRAILYPSRSGFWFGKHTGDDTDPGDGKSDDNSPSNDSTSDGLVTADMIAKAVQSAGASTSSMLWPAQDIADMFNDAIDKTGSGSFTTKARLACLVGESAQESQWFQLMNEINGSSASYAPYYGRGFIQLTWQSNYQLFGNWLKAKGVITDANMFVNNPSLVASKQWAAYTSVYYFTKPTWESHNLVWWCDHASADWHEISRAINRGSPRSSYAAYGEAARAKAIDAVLAVTPDPQDTGGDTSGVVASRKKLRAWMTSHLKDFYYSQDSWVRSHMMQSGGGDCSSTFITCYEETGVHPRSYFGGSANNIGYTGTIGRVGSKVNSTGHASDGPMQVGDAVLYSWHGYNPTWDHVAMYIGNGQVASHGGPGYGPVIQQLTMNVNYADYVEVRRFL